MSAQILIIDDEALLRRSLRTMLAREGFEVTVAASGREGERCCAASAPDIVLLDLVLGDADGLDLLRTLQRQSPETKVIVISAHGSIESAVLAMKLGAYDFIRKPFELEEILATVRNAARTSELEGRVSYLSQRERSRSAASGLTFCSQVMAQLVDEVTLIAGSPVASALLLGESGTGKQLVARMIHDRSPRAEGPFIELNCSTLPDNLVESELFGHERGAFSDARERKLGLVELAHEGTLFLDEVGDLSLAAQAKLLTFLEQRTFRRVGGVAQRRVETRVVAATNRDLPGMIQGRLFREDLWYRLNVMTVRLPSLRERPEDIAPLSEHFLQASNHEFGRRWSAVSPEAVAVLRRQPWPGNVRELRAVISRAALLYDDTLLRPAHLPADLVGTPGEPAGAGNPAEPLGAGRSGAAAAGVDLRPLAEVELSHIHRVLAACAGNRTLAAQHLGITRQTLTRRLDDSDE